MHAQEDASRAPRAHAVLTWRRGPGAEGCIAPAKLEQALERHLGRRVFASEGDLLVQGVVVRVENPEQFHAQVELRDGSGALLGRREVIAKGHDCRALDEALGLVLALAVDAQLVAMDQAGTSSAGPVEPSPPAPESAREPTHEPALSPAPLSAPLPASSTKRRENAPSVSVVRVTRTGSSYGLLLALGAGVGVGVMPAAALHAALTLGWRTPAGFSIELGASFYPSGRVPTSDGDAVFRAGYAELRGCAPLLRRVVQFDGCVGLWNGALRAEGHGFSAASFSHLAPLSGATAQLRAAWELRPSWFVRAGAGLGIPFVRDRFVVEGTAGAQRELHRLSAALALLSLEVGVQLR